jgi:cytochrome c biogenesis protein CcdA/thiol-disulfide isomerase/thioredoxin
MVLLLLFAFVAGAGTAITPCVLPVVPALLSASGVGGRRRPIGIVLGLALTFTITIVLLASVVKGVGLGASATRIFAIVLLLFFGAVLLIPQLAQRVQAPLSRLARFGPKTRGDGFLSGLGVGAALGFVCAPCAGPILAAVISVSSSTGPTLDLALVGIAYSIGLSTVMLIYAFAGRAVLGRIKRVTRGHTVERVLGAVLMLTGVAMIFNLDVKFESHLAQDQSLPAILVDPARALENSGSVQNKLASLRPASPFVKKQQEAAKHPQSTLPELGPAPNFVDTQDWFNTSGDRPLTMMGMRGHVVLVDFWTYTCINCIRTLPFVKGLYATYHKYGLDIVGIETPEFTFEQEASNVRQAIHTDDIKYPVVQDNRYGTWNAYKNQYWPAEYFIDADGQIRHTHFGEGDYSKDETIIRQLLTQAGAKHLPPRMTAKAILPSTHLGTPETYLDPQRSTGFYQPLTQGTMSYKAPPLSEFGVNDWALNGRWTVGSQSISPASGTATIMGGVDAQNVYLVMTSTQNKRRRGRVLLGGKPIPAADRGSDVGPGGWFTVSNQRLYNLVKLPKDEQQVVSVQLPRGISAYDFTFG